MPAHRHAHKPKLRTFHAVMRVTRTEQWWVEAESAEEAQALLAAGAGHHCPSGELIDVALEEMLDEEG
jgi:hypothetical protein